MLLHLSTWPEIEDYLKRSKTVVIPIGSNEQHGPTGLLGTDWLCPEIIAHEAQKTADLLVAPDLQHRHGPAPPGLPGHDRAAALDLHGGDRRLVPQPGRPRLREDLFPERPRRQRRHHRGGLLRALRRGELRRKHARLRLQAEELVGPEGRDARSPTASSPPATAATPRRRRSPSPSGPIRTRIKSANYAPQIAPTGPIREALDFRARYPDGRMGSDPGQATPGKGRRTGEEAAAALLVEDVADFTNEPCRD